MLYLFSVLYIALRWGSGPALVFSCAGAVAFDFCFIPPQRTFTTNDTWYLITLIAFLSIGVITSVLASSTREQARAAIDREAQTSALYSLTRSLSAARSLQQVLLAAVGHMKEVFGCESAVLLADGAGGDGTPCFQSSGWDLPLAEAGTISGAHQHVGADTRGSGKAETLPLATGGRLVGTLFLKSTDPRICARQPTSLLEASITQIAPTAERALLEEKAKEAEVLRRANELQRALLTSVSHDLQTPLAAILSALSPVAETSAAVDPAITRELARIAQAEARRLHVLIGNLLDISRLEAGSVAVSKEPYDVQDVIGVALEQLGEHRRGQVAAVVPPDLPLVPMDVVLITQVIVNLLDNAIKYSPDSGTVSIEAAEIGDSLEIRVLDRGSGVASADRERIFRKFVRGSGGSGLPGMGIGLAICKGFVEANHGRIWVDERAGGGSVFHFALPLRDRKERIPPGR